MTHLSALVRSRGLWTWRRFFLLISCLLVISACGLAGPQSPQAVQTLAVLSLPPQLVAYHVFVTDLGTGDLAEPGKATINGGRSLHGLALSPDGHTIFATDIADNRVDLFDISGGVPRLLRTVTVGLFPVHIAFSQGGRFAYVTDFQGAMVSVIDVAQGKVIATIKTPQGPHGLTVSPDGRFIYVACLNGQALAIINTTTNSLAQTLILPADTHPYSVVSDKAGRYLYVTDNFVGRVLVVDTTRLNDPAHAVVGGARSGQNPVLLAIAPDGKQLYVTNSGGDLTVLGLSGDPTHPTLIQTVPVGRSPHGVSVSPDGRYAVVANVLSGNLSVIDAASDTVVATMKGEKYPNDVLITQG